jgi:hypothetical protein
MKVRAIPLVSLPLLPSWCPQYLGAFRRFDWRNDRTGVGLPHGQHHREAPQVAGAREEVLAAPGAEARHVESGPRLNLNRTNRPVLGHERFSACPPERASWICATTYDRASTSRARAGISLTTVREPDLGAVPQPLRFR